MTEEESKAIEDYKRVIAMYFKYSDYDLFCSNLMKSGVKGTIQNTIADMINIIEKLQKENERLKEEKVTYLNKVYDKIDHFKYAYKKAEYLEIKLDIFKDLYRITSEKNEIKQRLKTEIDITEARLEELKDRETNKLLKDCIKTLYY